MNLGCTDRTSDLRGYAKIGPVAKYAGVSIRTFRDWLKDGLSHFRLSSGTILVAYGDIDAWLEKFRVNGSQVDAIVEDVLSDL